MQSLFRSIQPPNDVQLCKGSHINGMVDHHNRLLGGKLAWMHLHPMDAKASIGYTCTNFGMLLHPMDANASPNGYIIRTA